MQDKKEYAQRFFSMDNFLSCDWGTSAFRLRLVEVDTLKILAEEKSDQGIASTHRLWQQNNLKSSSEKMKFYLDLVGEHIDRMQNFHPDLSGIPLVFSGMASSSMGMKNLSYGALPFHTDGGDIPTAYFPRLKYWDHPVLIVSGIQSETDVMRGEETQLVGLMKEVTDPEGDGIFVFPGTHSKHIRVENRQVTGFKTYMTGEFFELLSKKSILAGSVEENRGFNQKKNREIFRQGVLQGANANILHASFWVRSNELFGKLSKKENLHFLSGLLIGTELKELLDQESQKIYLCCSSNLKNRYETAFSALGIASVHVFPAHMLDRAVIRGQIQIYQQSQKR